MSRILAILLLLLLILLIIFCWKACAPEPEPEPEPPSATSQLYGVTSCCPNNFVEIDPVSGAHNVLSAVGDTGFGFPVGASTINPGGDTYYIVRNDSMGDPHVLSINLADGTFVESPVLDDGLMKLGFDKDDDVLFGITQCCPNNLVHVDIATGNFTVKAQVGDTGFGFGGGAAAIDSAGNRFFVTRSTGGNTFLAAIDTQTGTLTESTQPLTSGLIKLGYDEDDDRLVGLTTCCPNEFVLVDQTSGAFTPISNVGDTGFSFATGAFAMDSAGNRFFMHRSNSAAGSDHVIAVDTATGAVTESGAMPKSVFSLGYDE